MLMISAVAVTVLLIGGAYFYFFNQSAAAAGRPILTKVATRGPFEHVIKDQGEVESSGNIEVLCEVESRNSAGTAILWVIEEGTSVQAGDKLVELDASALEQELKQQRVIVNNALAAKIAAISTLEQAKVALDEYLQGTFAQEEKLILSEILVAEENLSRAKETATFSERLAALGFQTTLQLKADQFAVEKATVELDLARSKLTTLREITKKKMLIQLEADIEAAQAQVEAATNSYDEELDKLEKITEQIKKCVIYAPQAGVVVHANRTSSRGGTEFIVEPGAMVRERQAIIRLPDPKRMQVKANINEASVPLLSEGLPALIRIGAFENQVFQGRVTKVNRYAEPGGWASSQIKEYATYIEILEPREGLRTGMTAHVEIFVERRPDALQVPVQALYEKQGHLFCLVQKEGQNGSRTFETRLVKIGSVNDTNATIEEGLSEGEVVVMNPRAHEDKLVLPDLPETTPPVEFVAATTGSAQAPPVDGPSRESGAVAGAPHAAGPPGGPRGHEEGGGSFDPAAMNPARMVDATFREFDTNEDGVLSADEIASMPEMRREGALRSDANGDGNVDRQEMTTALQRLVQMRRQNAGPLGAGPIGGGGE